MAKIKDLMEKRGQAIAAMRAILDKASEEGRVDLNSDEEQRHTELTSEIDGLKKAIDREQRAIELEAEVVERVERKIEERSPGAASHAEAFNKYLARGLGDLTREERSLVSGVQSEGGSFVPPVEWVNKLIKFVDDLVQIRQVATVYQLRDGAAFMAPSFDTDMNDADWTSELATGSEDTAMRTGSRMMTPHPFAKRTKISEDLLLMSAIPAEQFVRERLGYKFAVTEEKAFLTGDGASKPLGLMTASSLGIDSGRDIATDNTATAMTFDGLQNALFALKAQYQAKARWMFHRDAVKQLNKIKDGNGQYVWSESVRAGAPDMLMGKPMIVSEYMPNTFTTGLYVGIIGDFSFYWIVDGLSMSVKRLNELYAETNEVGFIGRKKVDGMPVLAEAFARVKLA